MSGIKQKVQSVISGEETGGRVFLFFLHSISVIYGLVVGLRSFLYDKGVFKARRLPCRVISIGNLTVGGTGKTPMTLYVAQLVKDLGCRPVVISRGYKGLAEKKGGIVSDGETVFLDPDVAGDEPFMMARKLKGIPVIVGARRYQAGMRAVDKFSPDVIVLDDAFQHRQLCRDTDLVLIDDKSYLGNEHLLPRGALRESVAGLFRADAFVLTRSGKNPTSTRKRIEIMVPGKPVFQSSHRPYILGVVKSGKIDLQDRFTEDISQHLEFF